MKGYSLDVLSNTGAYASHGHSLLLLGGIKSLTFILVVPTLQFKDLLYQPPLGWCDAWLWRPQVVFAVESMLDDAATALGMILLKFVYATPPAKEMLIRSGKTYLQRRVAGVS